jgi:hypothetical protein
MDFIEIAQFTYVTEAAVLESIMQSENIRYFLRNANSATVYAPAIPVILEVATDDCPRAVELIKNAGFEQYLTFRGN